MAEISDEEALKIANDSLGPTMQWGITTPALRRLRDALAEKVERARAEKPLPLAIVAGACVAAADNDEKIAGRPTEHARALRRAAQIVDDAVDEPKAKPRLLSLRDLARHADAGACGMPCYLTNGKCSLCRDAASILRALDEVVVPALRQPAKFGSVNYEGLGVSGWFARLLRAIGEDVA